MGKRFRIGLVGLAAAGMFVAGVVIGVDSSRNVVNLTSVPGDTVTNQQPSPSASDTPTPATSQPVLGVTPSPVPNHPITSAGPVAPALPSAGPQVDPTPNCIPRCPGS
jgi:hypothetical protein